jgi:redox-sensitive bicupin YhaK (pirin superfamily)
MPSASNPVLQTVPLPQGPWPTLDPFLFCVHHFDRYPAGDGSFGPKGGLAGRQIGQDFSGKDGWSMYHGDHVPGFPQHPHRGFETVTVARQGYIDHSDSLGAAARFGQGDLQWMTAGAGVVHSEMFPLLNEAEGNPTELFQIWLNLPARNKMAEPHFAMFWSETIPAVTEHDADGRAITVTSYARPYQPSQELPAPPPASWAADPANLVTVWTIKLAPGARWTLPATAAGVNRVLYAFGGGSASVAGEELAHRHAMVLQPDAAIAITNGEAETELLLLEGMPIGEPVAQHGPFVMNERAELQAAFQEYQRTQFGGWSWPSHGPVHGPAPKRFARHPDGTEQHPPG